MFNIQLDNSKKFIIKMVDNIQAAITRAAAKSANDIKVDSNGKINPEVINIENGVKIFTNNPNEIKVDAKTGSFDKAFKALPGLISSEVGKK